MALDGLYRKRFNRYARLPNNSLGSEDQDKILILSDGVN
jgi:hypothetical protein